MARSVPKWQEELSDNDRQHLKETTDRVVTLQGFKENREYQIQNDIDCYECETIAKKLDLR